MLKLFNSYHDTTDQVNAIDTHTAEFGNVGLITHVVLYLNQTYGSGTATANMLASSTLDVQLEGYGKLVDQMPLNYVASLCDLHGGAVLYDESTTGAGFTLACALPLGLLDVSDDMLRVIVRLAAQGGTMTGEVVNISLGNVGSGHERGIFHYERSSLVFGAASQLLEKQFRNAGYKSIYLMDFSDKIESFSVVPQIGYPSGGYIQALKAWNFATTKQEAFTEAAAAWNKGYCILDNNMLEATGNLFTVKVVGNGAGTVEVVTKSIGTRANKILQSQKNYAGEVRNYTKRAIAFAPGGGTGLKRAGLIPKGA